MHTKERLFVYSALLACAILALRPSLSPSAAVASPPPAQSAAAEPPPPPSPPSPQSARIATCDIYEIVEKIVIGERFEGPRKVEEERLGARLKPLEEELTAMEEALKAADPADAAAQEQALVFQQRGKEYSLLRGKSQQDYTDYVGAQYVRAFDDARAAAAAIAKRLGYTHVIASRTSEKQIKATDPERLIEAFLGRPVTVAPDGTDITDEVKAELKLR